MILSPVGSREKKKSSITLLSFTGPFLLFPTLCGICFSKELNWVVLRGLQQA